MKVLTIYAHHNPHSLCRALLDRFDAGLRAAGHEHRIIDLHAIGFDPVLSDRDGANWIDDSVPDDVLTRMRVAQSLHQRARGPIQRLLLKRWIGKLDARGIVRKLHGSGGPRDVAEQQRAVAEADALAFVAPVYFVGFPAILKGWIERVFSLGFAFGLTPEGWRGDVGGRLPLLKHRKALIISTTIFDQRSYASGLGDAMKQLIDEFALRYPGIREVQHEYFYAVYGADEACIERYLERAFALGLHFGDADETRPLRPQRA
jgi:NAD(P)H dehydrogenase (quinone)